MKKSAVCFTLSSNRAYAVASVMLDIKKYSPNLADEVVIFHNGLTKKDQIALNKILPTRFINYVFPIKDLSKFSQTITHYFTTVIFSKFEAFKLLNEYKCVIVLDYDLLIRDDLSDIKAASRSGITTVNRTAQRINFFTQPIFGYDMEQESRIGGIWVLWDHLPSFNEIHTWCYKTTEELAEYLYLPEMGIISLALEKFEVRPDQFLDSNLYECHPNDTEYADKAKILHCWGQPKYWNGFYSKQWEDNYSVWLSIGGTPFTERTLTYKLKKMLRSLLSSIKKIIKQKNT